jgi:CBS domain containing-hemolysin-like protein
MNAGAYVVATEATVSGGRVAWMFTAAAVLIALNAVYVAYEFAILAAKRSTFESPRYAGTRTARGVLASMSDLSMQLAGAQLGITMASLGLGYVAEPAFEIVIEAILGTTFSPEVTRAIGIAVSLSIVVFLHLVVGEMVPKNIALVAPDATVRWLVLPYRAYLRVFRPFIVMLNAMANGGARLVGVEPRDELVSVHTVSELQAIISLSREEGAIEADDAQMLTGALEFAKRPIAEIAASPADWQTLPLGATVAQAERIVAASGQERVPIVQPWRSSSGAPRFIGYVHARDLLGVEDARRSLPLPTDLVRAMLIVQAEQPLAEVLRRLRRARRQLALVEDKDGGAVGIVSVEGVARALLRSPAAGG